MLFCSSSRNVVLTLCWTALGVPAQSPRPSVAAARFLKQELARRLLLTESQTTRMRTVVADARAKLARLRAQRTRTNRRALRKRLIDVQSESMRAALTILTVEQRALWDDVRKPIADVARIVRMDDPRGGRGRAYPVVKTRAHEVHGRGYVAVTDHTDAALLDALQRLVRHRSPDAGRVIRVPDLGTLHTDPTSRQKLQRELKEPLPRFVVIVPRIASYRENTVLATWQVLSRLDADPQLDVLPGFLVARTPEQIAALVERSIAFVPPEPKKLRALGICEIPPDLLYKAYQVTGRMRKDLEKIGVSVTDVTVAANQVQVRADYPRVRGPRRFEIRQKAKGERIATFPEPVRLAMSRAALWTVFGHGSPLAVCRSEIGAFAATELEDKVIFCGSCFAARGTSSNLGLPRDVAPPNAIPFGLVAIGKGATIFVGNMAPSRGFTPLYPMFEDCLKGLCVGEAYQRVINALLGDRGFSGDYIAEGRRLRRDRGGPGEFELLTVLIGDPALRPFASRNEHEDRK